MVGIIREIRQHQGSIHYAEAELRTGAGGFHQTRITFLFPSTQLASAAWKKIRAPIATDHPEILAQQVRKEISFQHMQDTLPQDPKEREKILAGHAFLLRLAADYHAPKRYAIEK